MDAETQRLVDLLKRCCRALGFSNRELARHLEVSPGYVSKLLSGASPLRLEHVVRLCYAMGVEPGEFFALAFPRSDMRLVNMEPFRRTLDELGPPSLKADGPPPEG
jgi:transcriptional regulator with XRE-family HTH domain